MATTSSISLTTRNSLLRPIALGGMIIGIVQLIIQQWLVYSVLGKTPFITVSQYIASGILGNAAFEGGIATALLGVLIHLLISFVIAGVFILSAERIPFLRRYAVVSSSFRGDRVY